MRQHKLLEIRVRVFGLLELSIRHERELQGECAVDGVIIEGEYEAVEGEDQMIPKPSTVEDTSTEQKSTRKM